MADAVSKEELKREKQKRAQEFHARVEKLLETRGCSKAWLAKELGISRQALNHVLKHSMKPKFVSEIAVIFNVNPIWLGSGEGETYIDSDSPIHRIPVYTLQDVLSEDTNIAELESSEKILFKDMDGHTYFAVIFKGCPSMAERFEEDSILIFDKDKTPENKNFVIADTDEEGRVLRQFYGEKNTVLLKTLDPDYKSIKSENCAVLGTLVEARIRFTD